jgi:hypothetical protein
VRRRRIFIPGFRANGLYTENRKRPETKKKTAYDGKITLTILGYGERGVIVLRIAFSALPARVLWAVFFANSPAKPGITPSAASVKGALKELSRFILSYFPISLKPFLK